MLELSPRQRNLALSFLFVVVLSEAKDLLFWEVYLSTLLLITLVQLRVRRLSARQRKFRQVPRSPSRTEHRPREARKHT